MVLRLAYYHKTQFYVFFGCHEAAFVMLVLILHLYLIGSYIDKWHLHLHHVQLSRIHFQIKFEQYLWIGSRRVLKIYFSYLAAKLIRNFEFHFSATWLCIKSHQTLLTISDSPSQLTLRRFIKWIILLKRELWNR